MNRQDSHTSLFRLVRRAAVPRRPRLFAPVLGFVLLILSGCHAPGPVREPVPFESEPWKFGPAQGRKLTTEHYAIYTTMRDQMLLDALPDFVEAAYENYRQLLPPAHEPTQRMKVYLFVSRGHWVAFTRKYTGSRAKAFLRVRNGGYSERGVSVIEYVAHQITFPIFAHEGFHQYLYHHVNTRIPAWLNEGLAVCCEGQRWGNYKGEYGVKEFDPWYNPSRRNVLAQALISNHLHSLRKLLETHPGEVIEGSSKSINTYYAQVWALILFLREGADGKYAADFERMLDKLDEVELEQYARAAHIWSEQETFNFGEALFRNFITEDLKTFEREYFAFMRARFLGQR
ncbi:MAG: hypothetical protein KAY37_07425 [Phycisphaerae bacterium]|nr:hypothetical protein [Phycisphaerae bacterium]